MKKSMKRTLAFSVLSLVLCMAMLIGTTFAWFTDTATTGVNKIQAGNLDIDLVNADGKTVVGKELTWKKAAGAESEAILWEPGCTYVLEPVKVVNKGNLALKYKIEITGIDGDEGLNKVIEWTVNDEKLDTDHPLAVGATSEALEIKAHMLPEAGNDYQGMSIEGVSITVYATQDTVEHDSFDNQYDKDAAYPDPVTSAADMQTALNAGGSVSLAGDITPTEALTAGKTTTLYMNGKTIANTNDVWDVNPNSWSLVSVRNKGTTVTITGNGTFKAKENDCYAVDVQDKGATVVIENGTFIGNIHAVYVEEGAAIIKGGFFSVQQKYPDANKADGFVLNCYDANRANGTATITVMGGTFVNFNPADCWAEGEHTNFVADGYTVVSETQANGDIWYTVVAE